MTERPLPLKKRECLLVGVGAQTLVTVRRALRELAITGHACTRQELAACLNGDRFSIVVLDGDAAHAPELLSKIRDYCSRTAAVSLLLLPEAGGTPRGFGRGATMMARKPLTADSARKSLRSALSLTRPPRRRTFRLCVEPLVHIAGGEQIQRAQVLDVSDTGIAVRAPEMLPRGASVELRLLLPGMNSPVEVRGAVARVAHDRMGIRFLEFASARHHRALQDWMAFLRDFAHRDAAADETPAWESAKRRPSHRPPQRSAWKRVWSLVTP